MDTGLAGKGALVTGGSGGIGAVVCRALAGEGCRVAVHYHTGREAAEALAASLGGVALGADLRREEDADGLVPAAVAALGRLDVCVACAGIWPSVEVPVWEMPLERWEETLAANLRVTFLTARAFLRHATVTHSGALVLVGSTAGVFGEAGHADYAAAKGAILSGLLLSLKNEAARIGVRVNAVAPGWTRTPDDRPGRPRPGAGRSDHGDHGAQKIARPEDIAPEVVALASDTLSGHVTGQVVVVAGGMEGRIV